MDIVSGKRGKKVKRSFMSADVDFNCETCTRKKISPPDSSGHCEEICTNGCVHEWESKSRANGMARQNAA